MKLRSADFFESNTRVFLFLLIPTVLLYIKSLWFGFTQLDEKWLILDRTEYLKLWSSLPETFTTGLYKLYYRPLLGVSIFIDYKIGGVSPFIYHLTNIFWHLVSVFCLFKLLILFDVSHKKAAYLALIFSLHPMLVHAVAWVPGRNDAMLCTFTLCSIIYLKKHLLQPQAKYLVLNVFFFICALFTKENALALPVLFFFMLYPKGSDKKLFRAPVFWILVGGLWLLLRCSVVSFTGTSSLSILSRIINFTSGLFIYAGKCFFPLNQSVYPTANVQDVVMGVIAVAFLLFLFLKPGLDNRRTAFTGLVLFFILLVIPLWISSGKADGELYEHRIYTPLCGLVLFLSQVKFDFNAKALRVFFTALLLFFSVKSYLRENIYKNEDTFVLCAIKNQPGFFLFQTQYATYLCAKGDYKRAIYYYSQAIKQRPDKHQPYKDRGYAYFLIGDFKSAINDLNTAIAISGFRLDYYLDRCAVYNASNDLENTFKDLKTLVNCCETSIPKELRNAAAKSWQHALRNLSNKLNVEPNNDSLLFERAKLFFYVDEKTKGLEDLKKGLSISPYNQTYLKLYTENLPK